MFQYKFLADQISHGKINIGIDDCFRCRIYMAPSQQLSRGGREVICHTSLMPYHTVALGPSLHCSGCQMHDFHSASFVVNHLTPFSSECPDSPFDSPFGAKTHQTQGYQKPPHWIGAKPLPHQRSRYKTPAPTSFTTLTPHHHRQNLSSPQLQYSPYRHQ